MISARISSQVSSRPHAASLTCIEAALPAAIRLLVAADHALVRQALRAIVRVTPGLVLVGEAGSAAGAAVLAATARPDVVLLDLPALELDGLSAIARVRAAMPGTHIVVLSAYGERDLVAAAARAGANICLSKDVDVSELLRAIRLGSPLQVYNGVPRYRALD
jgi:DNA-binding NarL/FixJ family response regulator